jgi:hypothetical protein
MLNLPTLGLSDSPSQLSNIVMTMRFDWANAKDWVKILSRVAEIVNTTYIKAGYRKEIFSAIAAKA